MVVVVVLNYIVPVLSVGLQTGIISLSINLQFFSRILQKKREKISTKLGLGVVLVPE